MNLTWSDELEVEIMADRLGGGDLDRYEVARRLQLSPTSIWTLVQRGKLPAPSRYLSRTCARHGGGSPVARWSARQVAEVMVARGICK